MADAEYKWIARHNEDGSVSVWPKRKPGLTLPGRYWQGERAEKIIKARAKRYAKEKAAKAAARKRAHSR